MLVGISSARLTQGCLRHRQRDVRRNPPGIRIAFPTDNGIHKVDVGRDDRGVHRCPSPRPAICDTVYDEIRRHLLSVTTVRRGSGERSSASGVRDKPEQLARRPTTLD